MYGRPSIATGNTYGTSDEVAVPSKYGLIADENGYVKVVIVIGYSRFRYVGY